LPLLAIGPATIIFTLDSCHYYTVTLIATLPHEVIADYFHFLMAIAVDTADFIAEVATY